MLGSARSAAVSGTDSLDSGLELLSKSIARDLWTNNFRAYSALLLSMLAVLYEHIEQQKL